MKKRLLLQKMQRKHQRCVTACPAIFIQDEWEKDWKRVPDAIGEQHHHKAHHEDYSGSDDDGFLECGHGLLRELCDRTLIH